MKAKNWSTVVCEKWLIFRICFDVVLQRFRNVWKTGSYLNESENYLMFMRIILFKLSFLLDFLTEPLLSVLAEHCLLNIVKKRFCYVFSSSKYPGFLCLLFVCYHYCHLISTMVCRKCSWRNPEWKLQKRFHWRGGDRLVTAEFCFNTASVTVKNTQIYTPVIACSKCLYGLHSSFLSNQCYTVPVWRAHSSEQKPVILVFWSSDLRQQKDTVFVLELPGHCVRSGDDGDP